MEAKLATCEGRACRFRRQSMQPTCANVQFILVSRHGWVASEFCEGTCSDGLPQPCSSSAVNLICDTDIHTHTHKLPTLRTVQVFFPAYSEEQLLSILKVGTS
eukprot:1157432-Pelagomonas_calceolata.AAC.4